MENERVEFRKSHGQYVDTKIMNYVSMPAAEHRKENGGSVFFTNPDSEDHRDNRYFLVMDGTGNMKCSCGRGLIKMDNDTWKCEGGYPIYRPEKGEVLMDKFGNIMLKVLPHEKPKKQKG